MNLISFFTSGSKPKTGLSPTIQGWKVDGTKVIGQTLPSTMTEIAGGFYKYDFSYAYDDKVDYIFSASGGSTLPVSERYSYATNDACRSSSIIVHGDDNWGAVGGISAADVWTYATRTITDDTGAIDYISSQINPLHNDINWISSQVRKISSQISGISLGGGATPAQVWAYTTRTLTDDTGAIDYISSQVKYISSASEKYGYGGGSGKGLSFIEGRKSPWTHKQRDEIIQDVKDIKNLMDRLLKQLEKLQNKLKEAKSNGEVEKITEDISLIGKMISTMMTDDELDKVKEELSG